MKKPWAGRFEKDTDETVEQFTESVSFDQRLFRQDIRASIAHAQMLERCGLISREDLTAICEGLAGIEHRERPGRARRRRGPQAAHRTQPQRPGGVRHAPLVP
jgi:argininosuccinate lyase